jgi:LacI family transcriptional regulator
MVTIVDVARRAGVGVGTASRAISGRGSVSLQARARVQLAVAELKFKPSNVARALSTRTRGMIGIYVPIFSGDYYGEILQTVDAELRAVNRHMVAANGCGSGGARQQALDGIRFLIERECDGVIAMSNALHDEDFSALWSQQPKLVLLNRNGAARPEHCFSSDHGLAGRLAARALLSRGHRDIACIGGPHDAPDNLARIGGFRKELARHGVRMPRARQAEGDFTPAGGHAAAGALLRRGKGGQRDYSAVFCANDMMAIGAIARFSHAGLRIPGDLSVIGYDDGALAAYSTPALTTVRIPIHRAAVNGCRFLLNLCYGTALAIERDFPPELVWRESVGPGPHAARGIDSFNRQPAA